MVQNITDGRAWVVRLEVRENDKNSGIYQNPYATQMSPFMFVEPENQAVPATSLEVGDDGLPF
jgi:hypothetical protein